MTVIGLKHPELHIRHTVREQLLLHRRIQNVGAHRDNQRGLTNAAQYFRVAVSAPCQIMTVHRLRQPHIGICIEAGV